MYITLIVLLIEKITILIYFSHRTSTHSYVVQLLKDSGPEPSLLLSSAPPVEREEGHYSEIKDYGVALKDKVRKHWH